MIEDCLLIVDDEKDMLNGLARMLGREFPDLKILTANSAEKALDIIQQEPVDVALLDIKMPKMDGLELLNYLRKEDPWLTVIMMTGYGSIEMAVEAIRCGAYDFISKPFDQAVLFRVIRKSTERNRLIRENHALKQKICSKTGFSDFIGQSPPMRAFYNNVQTVARSSYTTLIRGESGTGKELTARAIHSLSKRRNRPLIMVNCPAIPEHLLESELFGHRRGAFTNATHDQVGLFAEADGGTICLDEIGDIPVSVQSKLLRVLQEQEIKPLGAAKTQKIDVRVIALTNRDLEKKIAERTFREDLLYRLNVVTLHTLPLKEIQEDIPLLINHFTHQVCRELELPEKHFSQQAVTSLMNRSWPGNVRELQNVVRRTVMFCPDETIRRRDLDTPGGTSSTRNLGGNPARFSYDGKQIETYKNAKERVVNDFAKGYISHLLKQTKGNVSKGAELSGLSRAALQKIMRKRNIKASEFRS